MDKKEGNGQSVHWKAWWRKGNIKCAVGKEYASCWVHRDCHVTGKRPEYQEEQTNVNCDQMVENAITGWAQR